MLRKKDESMEQNNIWNMKLLFKDVKSEYEFARFAA